MGPARAPRHIAFVAFAAMVMILGGPLGMFPTIEGKPAVELRGSAKTTNIELSDRLRAPRRKNKKGVPPRRRMHPTPAMLLHKGTPLNPKSRRKNTNEEKMLRRYHLQDIQYRFFVRLAGRVTSLAHTISRLPEDSEKRRKATNVLIDELFNYGVIPSKLIKIDDLKNFPATAFARIILFDVDPDALEKVRWNPVSKIREKIRRFHHTHDDYEVMNGQYVVPEAELENLRPLLDDDIFDPYTAFRRTEAELIQDKRKMLKDPYSTGRLPHFQTLEEVHEYQKNTMVEKTKLPGGVVAFRFVEPFASRIMHDEKVGDMLRSYDMKKGRLEAPPGTAIYARRKRLAEKNHRETKEHSAPGAVL